MVHATSSLGHRGPLEGCRHDRQPSTRAPEEKGVCARQDSRSGSLLGVSRHVAGCPCHRPPQLALCRSKTGCRREPATGQDGGGEARTSARPSVGPPPLVDSGPSARCYPRSPCAAASRRRTRFGEGHREGGLSLAWGVIGALLSDGRPSLLAWARWPSHLRMRARGYVRRAVRC